MWYIVMENGCVPYLQIVDNGEGEAMMFKDRVSAEQYATEACAWRYQVHEWGG